MAQNHGALLNGTTDIVGAIASFNIGIDTNYGITLQAGTVAVDVFSAQADGLLPATLYHYQAVIIVNSVTYLGNDVTFITLADSPIPTVSTLDATNIT
jgi:hypothetical protein